VRYAISSSRNREYLTGNNGFLMCRSCWYLHLSIHDSLRSSTSSSRSGEYLTSNNAFSMYWGRWYHRLRMRDSLRDTELLSRNRCYLTGITDDFNLQSRWHYRLRTFDSLRDADLQLENREHLTSLAGVSPALTAIPLYTESMVPPLDEGIIHSDAQVCGREVVGILLMLMIFFDQK